MVMGSGSQEVVIPERDLEADSMDVLGFGQLWRNQKRKHRRLLRRSNSSNQQPKITPCGSAGLHSCPVEILISGEWRGEKGLVSS